MSKDKSENIIIENNLGKTNKKSKKKKKHIVGKVLLTILLILITLVAIFAIQVLRNGGGLQGVVTTVIGSNSEKIKNLDDLYVLCMGKSQNMTDTIMVVKYDPQKQTATMLSIPRDSFVGDNENKATASDKINSKYSSGGAQATLNAVNDLTGMKLKYYLTVDTKALRDIVDTVGGIYFDVPIDMDYDDPTQDLAIHLKAGYQLLNGEQAEGVVRFRHNNDGSSYSASYGDNDLGRMKTQRAFIGEVINQVVRPSNITKVNQLMEIASQEIETNLNWNDAKDYVAALMKFNTSNLKSGMLPGTPQYLNNLSFYLVNKTKAKQTIAELFYEEESDNVWSDGNIVNENTADENDTDKNLNYSKKDSTKYSEKDNKLIKIEVINGTGSASKLNEAVEQLQNQGYTISKKGTTNLTSKTLIINRTNQSSNVENAISTILCTGKEVSGEDNRNVDFTIIIGKDY